MIYSLKYNYLATGMSEKEYNKIYKKLKVVGKETISGKQFKNLYSVKQYIDYIKGGENFFNFFCVNIFIFIKFKSFNHNKNPLSKCVNSGQQ